MPRRKIRSKSWLYEGVESEDKTESGDGADGGHGQHGADASPDLNNYKQDVTLQHPRCVFQLLKKHFARYTPEMVAEYCGVSKDAFCTLQKHIATLPVRKKLGPFATRLDGRNIPAAFK